MPYTARQKRFFGAVMSGNAKKDTDLSPGQAHKMLSESKGMPTKPPVKSKEKRRAAMEKHRKR